MSRIGAKASRARKEAKIRTVVSLAIAEGLLGSKVDPIRDLTRIAREEVAWETRVLLGFGAAAIALGIVYALHYSFANP